MDKLFSKKLLVLALTAALAACSGGGGGSSDSEPETPAVGDGGSNNGGDQGGDNQGGDSGSGDTGSDTPLPDNDPSTVTVGDVSTSDLGFATITATDITLPDAMVNAQEVYQLAHYIGRTDSEQDEENIDIPIRSYTATCATDTDKPRMFVSTTLSEGLKASDPTYGSVYELQYNPETSSFDQTGNTTILKQCYETHGITASADCSRVAVLCNTEYKASERYDIKKDIVEEHGTSKMKINEDNLASVAGTDNEKKYNDQIWLMEWDDKPLSEKPDAYVVNKMHGGTHLGTQELIYVENDSKGRTNYAFSVTARVLSSGSHYSAGLTVIDRDDWSLTMTGDDRRGWDWLCGHGHVLNIRAFYNPGNEMFGALCTSDGNKYHPSPGLNAIAIKMEDDGSSILEGTYNHVVPTTSAMISNGGGHTVVPVDANTNLSVVVSPKYIEDEDMDRFLQDTLGIDTSGDGPFDDQCAAKANKNCFFSYLEEIEYDEGNYSLIPRQGLYSGGALDKSSLTRVGIAKVDWEGNIEGVGINWLAEDSDCQISDPQLVDLKNGRYLFGYAQFQCISDNLPYNRSYNKKGEAMRMLVPKAYYVMEIDADLNVLEGPVKLTDYGWGGLDEPMYLGNGKVAWNYIKNPTFENYIGGQQNVWQAIVYHSKSVN
ncbi:hypothetical protein ACJJIU_07060 [Microbulbifer sp. CnH-101-E]|uniref:hypothetical protein n=1 Tax=unclassified Microbulbifer TaxID=2619833 RepID=UPI00403948EE